MENAFCSCWLLPFVLNMPYVTKWELVLGTRHYSHSSCLEPPVSQIFEKMRTHSALVLLRSQHPLFLSFLFGIAQIYGREPFGLLPYASYEPLTPCCKKLSEKIKSVNSDKVQYMLLHP